jgi:hypothetical protein
VANRTQTERRQKAWREFGFTSGKQKLFKKGNPSIVKVMGKNHET